MLISAPLNSEPLPFLQEIEIASSFQLPSFHIIGLPAPEVAEAKERVRSAIEASGIEFPKRRIVLNLSPASIRKRGTGLDLAMALGILLADELTSLKIGAWGELGLDGSVKPAGQITRSIYAAWSGGLTHLFLSQRELNEARFALSCVRSSQALLTTPPQLIPVETLNQAWNILKDKQGQKQLSQPNGVDTENDPLDNIHSLQSQHHSHRHNHLLPLSPVLERVLGVSASGHHHLLLLGPRGAGKSHAMEWLISLQQPLSNQDLLQQRLLRELRSGNNNDDLARRISSQVKPSALIGGASAQGIRPGEFSLAHGGLLIADEFPEWARDSREALREPLERGRVTLTRTQGSLELPARFLFAANGNFCPCGGWPRHLPSLRENSIQIKNTTLCRCTVSARRNYLSKLSGPILDRIDIVALVNPPTEDSLNTKLDKHQIGRLQEKTQKTRSLLNRTWGTPPGLLSGVEIETILRKTAALSTDSKISPELQPTSLRTRHKVAKLALTLAAWDETPEPKPAHYYEASCYRPEKYLFET